jgi:gluconolactonase
MASTPHVVSDQLPFGEGPTWCPDGTLVCTSITFGALYRIDVDSGATTQIADTAGGANSALLADDGSFVVCQNGGMDLSDRFPGLPPVRFVRPGLQLVGPDGSVSYLTKEPMQAPNDLVAAPHGTIWFTDPESYPPTGRNSRVLAYHRDGSISTVLEGYHYTNGLAVEADRETLVVVTDDNQLVRVRPGEPSEPEVFVADVGDHGGDGICIDTEGRYYLAARLGAGIQVFEPDGSKAEWLAAPEGAFITNCCFGGDDLRTLFATDAGHSTVLAWPGMPTAGLPVHTWPGPA